MRKMLHLIFPVLLVLMSFSTKATVHIIEATSSYIFSPSHVDAVVGDTIRWVWGGGTAHTTTSTSVPMFAPTWNGVLDSANQTYSYLIQYAGNYTYESTPDDTIGGGRGMPGSITATALATGISTVKDNANLNFYPNPTKSTLNIAFNSTIQGSGWLRIYDMTGKQVSSTQVGVVSGTNTLNVSLGNLDSGVYMAELYVGDKRIGVRRIAKN